MGEQVATDGNRREIRRDAGQVRSGRGVFVSHDPDLLQACFSTVELSVSRHSLEQENLLHDDPSSIAEHPGTFLVAYLTAGVNRDIPATLFQQHGFRLKRDVLVQNGLWNILLGVHNVLEIWERRGPRRARGAETARSQKGTATAGSGSTILEKEKSKGAARGLRGLHGGRRAGGDSTRR